MSDNFNELACRVCGNLQDEPPWGDDGQSPTYIICDCCGIEFGYEDCQLSAIKAARERWLAKGANWAHPKKKPLNWSLDEQFKNILNKYK